MNFDPNYYTYLAFSKIGKKIREELNEIDWDSSQCGTLPEVRSGVHELEKKYGSANVLEIMVQQRVEGSTINTNSQITGVSSP